MPYPRALAILLPPTILMGGTLPVLASTLARPGQEHAGPVSDTTLKQIEDAMSKRYARTVTASARPNPKLLAGLRVRVGSDIYESSVAGQLATLSL